MATPSKIRWWIIGTISVATVINYIDRTSLAVMWPAISRDTGLTKEAYASVVAAFMVLYAAGQSVAGRIFDRLGTRLGFVLSVAVWSAACAGHSLVRSVASLSVARGLLGLAEAGNWPGATKAAAEWFPRHERALAQGIFNAGASLGAVISAPLIALLFGLLGWRATFIAVGALGVVWLLPWWILARAAPGAHPWVNAEERAVIAGDGTAEPNAGGAGEGAAPLGWRQVLGYRQAWAVFVARFFIDPVWWLFVNWLPIYLTERFHFDVQGIGMFAWVPYVGAVAGSLSGGWISGHWLALGWSVDQARKRAILVGGGLTLAGFALAAIAATPGPAVAAVAIVLGGFQVMINNIQTLPSDYFGERTVGTVAGVGGMSAVLGVLLFSTWLVPVLSRSSFVPVFVLGASLVPLGIGALYLLGGEVRRLPLAPAPARP